MNRQTVNMMSGAGGGWGLGGGGGGWLGQYDERAGGVGWTGVRGSI